MGSKLEKIEKNIATLEIEVDKETFEEGVQKAYKKNVSKFNIPGFRKGKAPRKVIENYYGEGIFYEDAINAVCPDAYQQAVEEHDLEPVDTPQIDIVEVGKGKKLIFKAIVTVKPEVKLGQYNGIEVDKKEYPVTDEDVEKRLKDMCESNARMINVEDRPTKEGDMVIIDYAGFVDGEQFDGGTAENQSLLLGSGHFIGDFEKQLEGSNVGDDVEVNVKFPEDYQNEDLAGEDAVFNVKIKGIKEKELPELDDEFAKDVSEFDTLNELKEDIKTKLEQDAEIRTKREVEDKVIEKAAENAEIDIPQIMIDNQIDAMVRDFEMQLAYQGIKLENYLEYTNTSKEDFKSNFSEAAEKRVRIQLTLEKIAQAEGVTETEEEINEEIEKLAKQYNPKDMDSFKQSIREKELEYIKDNIIIRKTAEYLVQNAKLTTVNEEE